MLPVGILNASKRKVRITRNRTMAVLMALVHSHIHRPVEMDPRDSSAVLRRARSTRSAETRARPSSETGSWRGSSMCRYGLGHRGKPEKRPAAQYTQGGGPFRGDGSAQCLDRHRPLPPLVYTEIQVC